MESLRLPQLDRSDRHVRRSHVRISDSTARHQVAHRLERALRLISLSGESEGRVYFFRRVSLSGISANGPSKVWVDRLESTLGSLAEQAVHGSDPRAGSADAVYFHNYQEALELLLRQALRSRSMSEWFWHSILRTPRGTGHAIQISAILELLHQQPIPPSAIAAIIFSALGDLDPVALLSPLPPFSLRDWLRELGDSSNLSAAAPALPLPERLQTTLRQAAQRFGADDPRTVWLASLAVVCVLPGASSSGTTVARARSTLRRLVSTLAAERSQGDETLPPGDVSTLAKVNASQRPVVFDDEIAAGTVPSSSSQALEKPLPPRAEQEMEEIGRTSAIAAPLLLGEPTLAAGLYFLLNVLRQLRVTAALETCPELADTGFITHLLRKLAIHTGVAPSDPILLGLDAEPAGFSLSPEALAALTCNAKVWPPNLRPPLRATLDSGYFLRVWILAVRRWCWRTGSITVRDIVNRNGRAWMTRTDLDVTLQLAEADVRIRRIGLDIDPGWLPWFGRFGRVVRFHYRNRAPGESAC